MGVSVCSLGNAWEDGDEIVLISCRLESIDLGAIIDNYKKEDFGDSQQYLYASYPAFLLRNPKCSCSIFLLRWYLLSQA